jgi:hypothetical protein
MLLVKKRDGFIFFGHDEREIIDRTSEGLQTTASSQV